MHWIYDYIRKFSLELHLIYEILSLSPILPKYKFSKSTKIIKIINCISIKFTKNLTVACILCEIFTILNHAYELIFIKKLFVYCSYKPVTYQQCIRSLKHHVGGMYELSSRIDYQETQVLKAENWSLLLKYAGPNPADASLIIYIPHARWLSLQ